MHVSEFWGYIIGGLGMLAGIAGWFRNHKGDTAAQGIWMGTVNAKLDAIASELAKLNGIGERVALNERDLKTAFKAIDEIREQMRRCAACRATFVKEGNDHGTKQV